MDKILQIINVIIKTLISVAISFGILGLWMGLADAWFGIWHNETTGLITGAIGICLSLWVLIKILPTDTKNWIKNWTKPTITTGNKQ